MQHLCNLISGTTFHSHNPKVTGSNITVRQNVEYIKRNLFSPVSGVHSTLTIITLIRDQVEFFCFLGFVLLFGYTAGLIPNAGSWSYAFFSSALDNLS